MNIKKLSKEKKSSISRRNFIKSGSVIALSGPGTAFGLSGIVQDEKKENKIKNYRILGRTGFKVSDISMGGTRAKSSGIYRYAYDNGVNYFDSAEGYFSGGSERWIGAVQKYMDRKNIFITTKLGLDGDESEEDILNRFTKCQERLKTDYVDCLYIHGVADIKRINHPTFYSATDKLKADGRLRYIGLSSHGPEDDDEDSMEKVLCAAAEDGRFDMMLLIYNFMNSKEGEKVLAVCKKKNVGTTAMKTNPGVLHFEPFDPDNLTKEKENEIKELEEDDFSREEAIEEIKSWQEHEKSSYEKTRSFVEKYKIKTEDELRKTSIRWVLNNEDMHTVCLSFNSFDLVDKLIPLSGSKLSRTDQEFLDDYRKVYNDQYCRHGCFACLESCPNKVRVNTIMRYVYYFKWNGQEKEAMRQYAGLNHHNAASCQNCSAPCLTACPHHVNIKACLTEAHSLLRLV